MPLEYDVQLLVLITVSDHFRETKMMNKIKLRFNQKQTFLDDHSKKR